MIPEQEAKEARRIEQVNKGEDHDEEKKGRVFSTNWYCPERNIYYKIRLHYRIELVNISINVTMEITVIGNERSQGLRLVCEGGEGGVRVRHRRTGLGERKGLSGTQLLMNIVNFLPLGSAEPIEGRRPKLVKYSQTDPLSL